MEALTRRQWIDKLLKVESKEKLEKLLMKMYNAARENGYDEGYCDGIGEGCDYDGRMYEEVAYEWDDENDEPGERIDYKWDLK